MAQDDDGLPQMSLLDRLLDSDPTSLRDQRKSRGRAQQEFHDLIRRDLEALLNTRPCSVTWSKAFVQLDSSILNYGVTTVGSTAFSAQANRERFRGEVEAAIRRFEPRFLRISVTLIADPDRLDRTIRFRIEALVHADPAPEPLVFDSALDPSTQGITIAAPRHV